MNNPKRHQHRVRPGECISSIAKDYGFTPDTLWKDDDNAKLRDSRTHPQVLSPGDLVEIPEFSSKEAQCPPERLHRFVRKSVPEKLQLTFQDEDGKARAGVEYTLTVGDTVHEGTTNPKGKLEHPIPPGAVFATLSLGDEDYELDLGHLRPVTEREGLLERLWALGYISDGLLDSPLVHVAPILRDFQEAQSLDVTGELDEATGIALRRAYGC